MSFEINGHEIPDKLLRRILTLVKHKECIDTQTYRSMIGTLRSGSCKNVGNFLMSSGFIRDAYYDEDNLVVITQIPVKYVTYHMRGDINEESI